MTQETNDRRARVQRLKRILIITFLTLLLLPTVLCIISFARISSLEKRIDALTIQLEELAVAKAAAREAANAKPAESGNGQAPGGEAGSEGTAAEAASQTASGDSVSAVAMGAESGAVGGNVAQAAAESMDLYPDGTRKVYLTFDDGPSIYTDDILDILAEYDVKATFFVVGKTDETSIAAYKRIVEEGHTLGMHSYSHKYNQIYASEEAFQTDYEQLRSYLEEVTGVSPKFYRFPGGSSNTVSSTDMRVFAKFLRDQGVTYFDWNISSGDASGGTLSASTIRRNATSGVEDKNTAVILFHDAGDKYSTVRALPDIIKDLQAMENTVLLPISDDTVPIQHVTFEE